MIYIPVKVINNVEMPRILNEYQSDLQFQYYTENKKINNYGALNVERESTYVEQYYFLMTLCIFLRENIQYRSLARLLIAL